MGKSTKVRPHLLTRSICPENQETPIHFLANDITPTSYFYRRNHFSYPNLTTHFFCFPIEGSVYVPRIFTYQELLALPSKTIKIVLECAGNKRALFHPDTYGEQWKEGAIGQAYWKGVSLTTLLQYTGVHHSAREVVVEGYDTGPRTDMEGTFRYVRSLPLHKALHPDTIIAYELNGRPIPYKHGYPLRLLVPQWYAMASVKWIKKITVIDDTFQGPFQTTDYVYYPHKNNDVGKHPVTTMNSNSTIQQPLHLSTLSQGAHLIKGIAWTGEGTITAVDISIDNGHTRLPASLQQNSAEPYSWVRWSFRWHAEKKGEYTLLSRATDSLGRVQPPIAVWNRKGYGYNALCMTKVKIE